MSTSRRKELARLEAIAITQGWRIIRSGSGHLKWMPPETDRGFVTTAATPSDARAIKNIISELRRHGLRVPRKGH